MRSYLLRCACGADVPVSKGIAGGRTVCQKCGQGVAVPALRELQLLPVVDASTANGAGKRSRSAGRSWSKGHVMLSAGTAMALLAWTAALLITMATKADGPDPALVSLVIDRAPLMEVYAGWKRLALTGVERGESMAESRVRKVSERGSSVARALAALGGIGTVIAIVGLFLVSRRDPRGGLEGSA